MTQRNIIYGKVIKAQIFLSDTEDVFEQDKHICPEKPWIVSQGHLLPT